MQKIFRFVLLKRRPDISHDTFSDYWRTKHVEVLVDAGLPEYNLTYTQNHFESLPGEMEEVLLFDGSPQMLQLGETVVDAGFQQDPRYLRSVRADEEAFLSPDDGVTLFATEEMIHVRPRSGRKLMMFCRLDAESTGQDLRFHTRQWLVGCLKAQTAGLQGSVTVFHTFQARGKCREHHFNMIVECDLDERSDVAAILQRTLVPNAPTALNLDTAFIVISRPLCFY